MTDPISATAAPVRAIEFTFLDVLRVLRAEWRRLALATFGAGALAFAGSYLLTPKFTATVKFMAPNQQGSGLDSMLSGGLGSLVGGLAGGLGMKNQNEMWVGMLQSRTVEDAMVNRFGLIKRFSVDYRFQARKKLEGRTQVQIGKDGIITVDVEDPDPKTAAAMADAYLEELQKLSNTLAITDAAQRRVFFEGQLKQANEMLYRAEAALARVGVNTTLLKASPEAAVEVVGQLKAQETAAQIRLNILSNRLAPNSPEWQDAQRELEAVRAQLAEAARASAALPVSRAASGAGVAPGNDYIRRFRDFKYAETLYELMARQYELAKADEAREGAELQVIDHAAVPEWKSSPKRSVLSVIVALVAFVLVATQRVVKALVAGIPRGAEA